MDDPFSSVESMLLWQISILRNRIIENRESVMKCGEVFPLPKSNPGELPKGVPDGWAFGNKKPYELAIDQGLVGLKNADDKLNMAEESLSNGDSAKAIFLVLDAQQRINSSTMFMYSTQSVSLWRFASSWRKNQQCIAKKDRGWIELCNKSMTAILKELANKKNPIGDFYQAKELWPEFLSELDSLGLNPEEVEDKDELRKTMVLYDYKEVRRSMKFGTFENRLSSIRNHKKS